MSLYFPTRVMNVTGYGDPSGESGGGSTLRNDLVAYWRLDEASGNATDQTANANTLTAVGAPVSATGLVWPNARQYTAASTQYHTIADNAFLSMGAGVSFHIIAWVYMDTAGVDRTICGKYSSLSTATSCEYALTFVNSTNRFRWSISDGTSVLGVSANVFGNVPLSTWCFLSARFNDSTDTGGISVNNGAYNNLTATTCRDGTQAFRIGADASAARLWNGRIGPVLIYKRVLTDAEVTQHYNGGSGYPL